MSTDVDVVILGGGSSGYACALRAAQLGLSVTLIERDRLGGTCLHRGCIPTKALLHAGEVADTVREGPDFGVLSRIDGIEMAAVHAYKDEVVTKLYRGLAGLIKANGITVVTGDGRFAGDRVVEVDGIRHRGKAVVLATGSTTRIVPGIEIGERVLTSDTALQLHELPSRVAVIGGGVIGVEFASLWRSLGAKVTIIEAAPRLLPGEDEFSSELLDRAFRRRTITIRTGTAVTGVLTNTSGVSVRLADETSVDAEYLLIAVGRTPNTDGLEQVGVCLDAGFVATDGNLETNLPNVFAVGDLVAGPQLAHRGFQHGIVVAERIAGRAPRPVPDHMIPRVTYSEPQVASVGLTEVQAAELHGEVHTVTYDFGGNGKSQILRSAGAVKLIQAGSATQPGAVVGVHMVGTRVGELIGEAQLIVNWEAYADDVAPLIHAHPTQSEALGEAHRSLAGAPLHSHH